VENKTDKWFSELRQKAEQRLPNPSPGSESLSLQQSAELIHDLQVQQAELELQNEELRETQKQLVKSRDQYWILFNQAPVGYALLDEHGLMREINQTLSEMLDRARADILNKPFSQYLHPDDQELFLARFRAIFRQPEKKSMELRLMTAAGKILFVNLEGRLTPLTLASAKPDTGKQHMLVALTDINQRKQAEADLAVVFRESLLASQAKSELLSSLSHELKTPMNAVLGFTQLLLSEVEDRLSERQKNHLHQVLQSGEKLLRLIDNLLDLSRLQVGDLEVRLQTVAVSRVLAEVCAVLAEPAQKKRITIEDRLLPAVDQVYADPQRLRQVLLNLLGNAIKYHREEGRVTVSGETIGADFVRINIEDDGPGIPDRIMADLFNPFRKKADYLTSTGGLGVGLPLSKRLMELMKGSIEVQSNENQGSCFSLIFRRQAPSEIPIG